MKNALFVLGNRKNKTMKLCFVVLLILLFSCKTQKDPSSKPQHTVGNITSGYPKALWVNTSFEQAKKIIARSKPHLDETNEKLKILNNWLIDVHSILSDDSPEIKHAPQPKIIVIKADKFNANVEYISTCVNLKVVFLGNKNATELAQAIELEREYFSIQEPSSSCVEKNLDFVESSKVFLHFEKIRQKDHCYKIKEKYLEANPQCLGISSYPTEVGKIIYPAASNYIVVSESLFDSMSSEHTKAFITHELAHYYKLHYFHLPDEYFYFYQLDRWNNPKEKPRAIVNGIVKEIRDAILRQNEFYIGNQKIAEQKYHSAVFAFMARYLNNIDHNGLCDNLEKILSSKVIDKIRFSFPFYAKWPDHSLEEYYLYEESLLPCLQLSINSENIESVSEVLDDLPFTFINNSELPQHKTLNSIAKEITQVADSFIDSHNVQINQLFLKADENKIGFYTYEQEADDISLEISQKMGIPFETNIQALFELLKKTDSENKLAPYPGILNYEDCMDNFKQGFQKFIPIGNYESIHHSRCFRIYNIYREYQQHYKL